MKVINGRRAAALLVLTAIALTAVPTAASGAPGWRLPLAVSHHGGQKYTSKAVHCGASQFGVYRFKNTIRSPRGSGSVVFRVGITADGALHRAKVLGFRGDPPRGAQSKARRLLARVRFRYAPGQPALVESRWPNGALQATRPFNPVPGAC